MLVRSVTVLLCLLAVALPGLAAEKSPDRQVGKKIAVYKSPTCGCCAGWADYLRRNGFAADAGAGVDAACAVYDRASA